MRLLLTLAFCGSLHAATIAAATCSQADVQTAINSASNGDTVTTPGPCTSSWSSQAAVSGKGITLDGGGNTTLSNYAFGVTANATAGTRITGFIMTNCNPAVNQSPINFEGSESTSPGRIDHNSFPSTGSDNICITIYGNLTLLIDHNTISSSAAPNEFIHNMGYGAGDSTGWANNVTPGSPNFVYIEDNTFTYNASGNPAYYFGASAVQSYYGARTVFRHNTCNMCQIDYHGTAGSVGARWGEVYANTFNTGVANASQSSYIVIRGGSGVIFDNVHTGSNCGGCGNISLYEEDTGTWPLAYSPGSGLNGNTNQHASCSGPVNQSPAYAWNNGADMPVVGDGDQVQENRDFFVSASQPGSLRRIQISGDTCSTTYSYTAFTYPYPLTASGFPNPSGSSSSPAITSKGPRTIAGPRRRF